MLQQTQVARVVERWTAWLERWPTAGALAVAPRAEVLGAWVGLGYNRRAVRLQEACAVVAASGWPADLTELPGVGPYTAAAVGSFAFGRDEVAVDTNVGRVLGRYGAGAGGAGALAPEPGGADVFNHATMDLGATICTARVARCGACPVAAGCASRDAVVVAPRTARGRRVKFEDTNRWARGRVVSALAAGEPIPDMPPDRLEQAVQSLLQDGLVVTGPAGLSLG